MNPKEIYKLDEATLRIELDSNPFGSLKINDNWKLLEDVEGRSACDKCCKSRKYFCYTCHIPVASVKPILPQLSLPMKIDIIKHRQEIDGKSTAIHAVIIAPKDVSIFTYPDIPDYSLETGVILIYPNKKATTLEELVIPSQENFNRLQINKIRKAVFIDSTWNQSKGIYKDPRIQSIPCIVLRSRISQFWRHQKGSPRWYLATIEAIHQLLIEHQIAMKIYGSNCDNKSISNQSPNNSEDTKVNLKEGSYDNESISVNSQYDNKYDDLLFFFRFMYEKIHQLYDHDSLCSYKRPLT